MADTTNYNFLESEAFTCFAFYSSILIVKMFVMSAMTAIKRLIKNAFANPEDVAAGVVVSSLFHKELDPSDQRIITDDPDVERVRRAHLNDLENILPFFVIGFLYCVSRPNASVAHGLFLTYTVTRILHTLVYAVRPMKQPTRLIVFLVGMGISNYMAIAAIIHFGSVLFAGSS